MHKADPTFQQAMIAERRLVVENRFEIFPLVI